MGQLPPHETTPQTWETNGHGSYARPAQVKVTLTPEPEDFADSPPGPLLLLLVVASWLVVALLLAAVVGPLTR